MNNMVKRLYRRRRGRVIAGVCGGLADYFAVSELLVRLIFVVLLLWGGIGLLIYVILWLLTPLQAEGEVIRRDYNELRRSRRQCWIAGVCGGIAEHLAVDVVWIRLLFVTMTFFLFGGTIVLYLLLWIIVPPNEI